MLSSLFSVFLSYGSIAVTTAERSIVSTCSVQVSFRYGAMRKSISKPKENRKLLTAKNSAVRTTANRKHENPEVPPVFSAVWEIRTKSSAKTKGNAVVLIKGLLPKKIAVRTVKKVLDAVLGMTVPEANLKDIPIVGVDKC